jgi:hypothetical protein
MERLGGDYQDWRTSRNRELAQEKIRARTFLLRHQLFVDIEDSMKSLGIDVLFPTAPVGGRCHGQDAAAV